MPAITVILHDPKYRREAVEFRIANLSTCFSIQLNISTMRLLIKKGPGLSQLLCLPGFRGLQCPHVPGGLEKRGEHEVSHSLKRIPQSTAGLRYVTRKARSQVRHNF